MEALIYLFGLIAIMATLRVITHTKPIHALIYLIVSLLSISCIFFLIGSYFAGALEIIIYTGAIMVLFIFVVMMLNIDNYEAQKHIWMKYKLYLYILCIPLILLMLIILVLSKNTNHVGCLGHIITPKAVGIALFSHYLLVVELASMLLLAGLLVSFHLGYNRNIQHNYNKYYIATTNKYQLYKNKRK